MVIPLGGSKDLNYCDYHPRYPPLATRKYTKVSFSIYAAGLIDRQLLLYRGVLSSDQEAAPRSTSKKVELFSYLDNGEEILARFDDNFRKPS